MEETKLIVGAYYLAPYASTEAHVRDLARCGIDVVVNMRNDRAALDLLAAHGVGAIVSGIVPGWFGGDGSNAGTLCEKNPLEKYKLAAERFEDHPAIVGIDVGDEPSSLDFDHYGKVISFVEKSFPKKYAYLNIYPSYAVKGTNTAQEIVNQLGTACYEEYIDQYVRKVNTPYICFDYYLYSAELAGLYESLATVSKACRQNDRSMWMVLQVNSHQADVFISEDQLRFQANCALAFGARRIIWACYCAGWWYNHVLDKQGNKTQQYEKLSKVNGELHRLGETYMQYRNVKTHFVGDFTPQELGKAKAFASDSVQTKHFLNLRAENGKLLVGQMLPNDGTDGEALFILAADDPSGEKKETYRVTFACDRSVRAIGADGAVKITRDEEGCLSFEMKTCQGVLLVAQ